MRRWLVNENVSGTVIRELRERGHDVLSVKESLVASVRPMSPAYPEGVCHGKTWLQKPGGQGGQAGVCAQRPGPGPSCLGRIAH